MNRLSTDKPLCIALHAIGGQGGGVLANWLVALAESQGWVAQSTSVPGVAQRTGATVYYIEMLRAGGGQPVMALMPAPGQVDLVVAAEWMEVGRAIQRGFVTPDKTLLIGSTHRGLSVAEKIVPGNGIRDAEAIETAGKAAAKRFMRADLEALARKQGSVISASLFGAIARSGALPFERDAFEAVIRKAGIGVDTSLAAFGAAYDLFTASDAPEMAPEPAVAGEMTGGTVAQQAEFKALAARVAAEQPESARAMALAGLRRVVDFQDTAYGGEYLDHLQEFAALDHADLCGEVAKYLAQAMAYQDVIRVADLKTRATRFDRIGTEMALADQQILTLTEFMHPRGEEMIGLMPHRLADSRLIGAVLGWFAGGKRLRSDTVFGFTQLYALAGLRRWRRSLRRHHLEMQVVTEWLYLIRQTARHNPELAIEIAKCRRLIKGYGDTHQRGASKYHKIINALQGIAKRPDAAQWAANLRRAALQDATQTALDGAIAAVDSFAKGE